MRDNRVALFALIAYPRVTVLVLGAGSMIAGAGWGYAQITRMPPYARGRLVITPLGVGRFTSDVTRGADKWAIRA